LQEILPQTQVKTSKQLHYLKKMGLVIAKREANWMIYRLRGAFGWSTAS
jgi:DNA-binding transcriptional ArsR family regulator